MRQYLQIKAEHPDAILFFRLGDFYEMFFEDAVFAAKKLDLTLTTRDKGRADAIPMCGVPHHAARGYVARLTDAGHKVVLCEQVEDPKQAKGLVKREVVRIVTPGVVLDDEVLDPKTARYLAAVVPADARDGGPAFGLAYLDVSTGEFRATEVEGVDDLVGELARAQPHEVLVGEGDLDPEGGALRALPLRFRAAAYSTVTRASLDAARAMLEAPLLDDAAEVLEALPGGGALATRAAADVVQYARDTQPSGQLPLSRLQAYRPGQAVVLDEAAVANLELCATIMGGKKAGSLLSVIDETCTAPGGRLLRRWLLYPLTELAPIRRRQDAVEYFFERAALRAAVREELAGVADLERLAARVSLGVATPRDLGRMRDSLERLPGLVALLAAGDPAGPTAAQAGAAQPLDLPELLRFDPIMMEELAALHADLCAALVDEPPPVTKDGGFIREGYCAEVDEHRSLANGGKEAILAIEARERERTGISVLKVKYNRVFGYYIEVTKPNLSRVPDDYVRKQTIATGERFVTSELAELEAKVLSAQEALIVRENQLFRTLCESIAQRTSRLTAAGAVVAAVDCAASLAEVGHGNGFVRPEVTEGEVLDIVEGRHPVIERTVPAGSFVPNDCHLDPAGQQIVLVTGPNMAGKSTYMRQVAHIVLLAQMGSFVPAKSAVVGLVDRIFTRVGAADNLARGESTFMVEMRETAAILGGATRRSLVVLDEVGRGTSTFDGVSIAWAVTEYLHDAIGARTLFATHYHELCELAQSRPRVHNVSVAVREHRGEIVFLRQVVPGGSNRSYGIDVARLAGLPRSVISRSRQILQQLEGGRDLGNGNQLALFASAQAPPPEPDSEVAEESLADRLRELDPNRTTPMEALAILADLCEIARDR